MADAYSTRNLEPTLLGAVWRYRWLVVFFVLALGLVGVLFAGAQPERWTATATVVVEDPRASALFEQGGAQRPDRYVQDQAAILYSQAVAQAAVESELNQELDVPLRSGQLLRGLGVVTDRDSDVITISFTADDPRTALAAVNATAAAYQSLLAAQAAEGFSAAIAEIDSSIDLQNAALAEVQTEIATALRSGSSQQELATQYEQAKAKLVRLQAEIDAATEAPPEDPEDGVVDELTLLRAELDDLLQQFQTFSQVNAIELARPEIQPLVDRQDAIVRRLADLAAVRDQLRVDAELAGTGVLNLDEAREASPSRTSTSLAIMVFGLLGAVASASLAYFLALRRRRFHDRSQPELVLGAPVIAEVPAFRQEGLKSPIPVRAAPRSASAEAFRFAAAALDRKPGDGTRGMEKVKTLAITSAKIGEGKTVVAVNTALAVARSGKRVLVIDADFGSQAASELLAPGVEPELGFTEVVEEGVPVLDAAIPVEGAPGGPGLHLLARGWRRTSAPEFLSRPGTREFLSRIGEMYDLVILDTPPLLQVAYASAILALVDAALIVVPHEGPVADLEQVADRLDLLHTKPFGYIYNAAPLRMDMTATEGSMVDILGHAG